MNDLMENVDLRIEHKFHKDLLENCSECYKEARKCKDCNGYGEVSVMESVYPGEPHQALVGSEICENCSGDGVEPDEEIINERFY
jgi:DnaJ-class molecular chaperone